MCFMCRDTDRISFGPDNIIVGLAAKLGHISELLVHSVFLVLYFISIGVRIFIKYLFGLVGAWLWSLSGYILEGF